MGRYSVLFQEQNREVAKKLDIATLCMFTLPIFVFYIMKSLRSSASSPPGSDLPASFTSLNDDTLSTILQFVGNKSFATCAGIDKRCRDIYLATKGMTKETIEKCREQALPLLANDGTTKEEIIEDFKKKLASRDIKKNGSTKERFLLYGCGSPSSTPVTDPATIGMTQEIFELCKEIYYGTNGITKETFLYGYGSLKEIKERIEGVVGQHHLKRYGLVFRNVGRGVVLYNRRDVLTWALQQEEKNKKVRSFVLSSICNVAGEEERFDLLEELWSITEDDDKGEIFGGVAHSTFFHGKLEVLKWLEDKGVSFSKRECVIGALHAKRNGHLHILKWLRENNKA